MRYSPQGDLLASAGWDGTAGLWDSTTNREIARLTGSTQPLLCVAFSPNSEFVAAGGHDGKIRVWQIDGELVATLDEHRDHVHGFSPQVFILLIAVIGVIQAEVNYWLRGAAGHSLAIFLRP